MIETILGKLGYVKHKPQLESFREAITALTSNAAMATANAAVYQYNQGLSSGRMQGFSEAVLMISRAVYDRYQVINGLEITPAEVKEKEGILKALNAVLQDVQFIQANYAKGEEDAKENAEKAASEPNSGDAGSTPGSGEGDAQNNQESAGDSAGNPDVLEEAEAADDTAESGTVVDDAGDRPAR